MEKTIDKELLSHLLKLDTHHQEKVLAYIKDMMTSEEMNMRVEASEKAIYSGEVKTFDQFNEDFENWKKQKKGLAFF